MQNIIFYVAADATLGTVKDFANSQELSAPTLIRGVACRLKMRLFENSDGTVPYPIEEFQEISSWKWVMDNDFKEETNYKLVADHSGIEVNSITVEHGITSYTYTEISIPISGMNTVELVEFLGDSESKNDLHGELIGYNGNGESVFVLQVKNFTIRNRISSLGNPTALPSEYLTEAQVKALIAAGCSEAAESIAPEIGANGNWFINGKDTGVKAKANDGKDGTSVSHAWSGTTLSVTSASGTSSADLKGPKGDAFTYDDFTEEQLAALKGPKGDGIDYDASGSVTGRSVYDDKPKGFRYATTNISSANRNTTLTIYTKLSDGLADWDAGISFVFFGAENEFTAVEPAPFEYKLNLVSVTVDISRHPNAAVLQVEVQTSEGWLTLPYCNEKGILKILRNENSITVFLGSAIPSYSNGRIYFSQLILASDSDDSEDIPVDPFAGKIFYGCINDGTTYKVSQITADMLEGDTVTEADIGSFETTIKQTVGGVLFVLVPADSGLAVKKDDGVGGKVPFDEDIGAAGTGANGIDITLNGTAYKAYGEFSLIDAETTIYIEGE